jgi:hypothetical protein
LSQKAIKLSLLAISRVNADDYFWDENGGERGAGNGGEDGGQKKYFKKILGEIKISSNFV